MNEFPEITIPDPSYVLWLWVIIPGALAVTFFLLEPLIEKITEKRFGKPWVGLGYILMGSSLLSAAATFSVVPDILNAQQAMNMIHALESIGLKEVRVSVDSGTFGAIYHNELLRGIVIPDTGEPGTYLVQQTFPRG